MKITIDIETGNAAFQDDLHDEMTRTGRKVFAQVAAGYRNGKIMDSNGNTVGFWRVTGK